MAKIIVSADNGEVEEILSDANGEIGDPDNSIARGHMSLTVGNAVQKARKKDKRKKDGRPQAKGS